MADQIIFNVGLKMEILQSSISELQKVLNNLEPNSRGFKDLGRVISSMTDDLSKLQKASNNGFINETQINQAGKVIDRIEDRLNNAQQIIRSLSFRDIQLDNSQLQVFNDLQDQLRAIEAQFNAVKEQAKQGLLSDANTRDFLSGPVMSMVNDLDKDFDTIAAKVDKKVAELRQKAETARQNAEQAVADQARVAANLSDPMKALSEMDQFRQFFQVTKNGTRFATMGFEAGQVKQQFLEQIKALASSLGQGNDPAFDALATATYSQMNQAFRDNPEFKNFFDSLFNINNINKRVQSTGAIRQVAEANYNRALEIQNRIATERSDNGSIGQAEHVRAEQINSTTAAIHNYQQAVVDGVRSNQELGASFNSAYGQLDQFKDQLSQTTAEMLRVQGAQRTFNSLKMAVTNFMGFNQVLNLTKRAINEAAQHIQKLDSIMNQIAVVTDMTTADLWDQVDVYSEIAQNYGVTIEGAYEVSKIFYMQGPMVNI